MAAGASLLTAALEVEPGAEVTARLQVRNTGIVVDEFSFEIVGPASEWTTVDPDVVGLAPGDEGTVTIRIAPPRLPTTTAGEVPFGVKVLSREDPDGTVVEEGTVTVAAFSELTAELVPRTSRGRTRALHNLAIDNRGNTAVDVRVSANEPEGLLRTSVAPPAISAPPGSATFAKVRLRPVKRFMRGPSRTHGFEARVEGDAIDPVVLDGTMLQDPLVASWLLKAVALLAAVAVVAVVGWVALIQPHINEAVKSQVTKQLAAAGVAPGSATAAQTPAAGATAGAGTAVDGRLAITGNGTAPYTVPAGRTLQLTDIVLENPNGDAGSLIIARSGTVLLQLSMANFRDLDYHFVAPMVFGPGTQLQLITAGCTNACSPGAYFSGYLPPSS